VVGVLVDDAIVEIENIVRHLREREDGSAFKAALDASAEIGLAVVATTATILAVFVPVAFMPGIPGQFFRQFGLTVATAVFFSLVVARMLTPLLGAYFLKPKRSTRSEEVGDGAIGRRYLGLLGWCMRHRWVTLAGATAFFVASVAMVPLIPQDFVPASDRGRAALAIELAPGATLAETEAVVQQATRILKARPEVASVFASLGTRSIGGGGPAIGSTTKEGEPRMANLTVTLLPRGQRAISQQRFEAEVRPALERLPGARVRFGADGQSGAKASITLVGDDAGTLAAAARELERQMRTVPQLAGARSTASLARPELQILPREARASELGVSSAAIATTARIATIGDIEQNLARFNLPDRQIPIRVMLDEEARGDLDQLRTLRVEGRAGLAVPLDAVAEIRHGAGPAQIDRLDRVRKATVEAELNGLPLGEATRLIAELPIMRDLPAGVRERTTGDKEVMAELFGGFAGRARHRRGAGLPGAGAAVRRLRAAHDHHVGAAPLARRGADGAAAGAEGARRLGGDRRADAHGHRGQELHPAGGVRDRGAARRPAARRRAGGGGAQAGAADRDDHHRHDGGHGAHRRRRRRGRRVPRAHGVGGHRRPGHVHPAQLGGGAGRLHADGRRRDWLARRVGRLGPAERTAAGPARA
jgi:HAE1 family hydrophobic/amphiphilic exporter-1